ncbi:MAG TPA: methylated-DNA--[protein]-cysteine S-methyltransferase [Devosiaceae bacterium]|nr:methylated-DNA--[protein]-cysteine S-methyltransferase [Devosiaceae bacterium]
MLEYCLIATAFGPVGLAWSENGLVRLQLPDVDSRSTLSRLTKRLEGEENHPPAWLEPTVIRLQRYFSGAQVDFSKSPLDLEGVPEFNRSLYLEMLQLGWGETVTYGELAERTGRSGAAQSVGRAMGRNPLPVIVPCHRVLAAGNRMGGFSAPGGVSTKFRLLEMEGVHFARRNPAQMAFAF